ncbi:MAR-binding filament-like protein 1 [Nicotiana tomentosiformis]|uniref:MAR-binding filament-like protein 1 n=1 Tax=Nicotiana tomentosiformis TaxID=4098 RepID=UPI00388C699E
MLRDEDEEKEDVDCLLVARERESIEASKVAELVTVEVVQLQAKVISRKGPSRVPESMGVDDAPCRDEQPAGVPEGSSSEALKRKENSPSDSLRAIYIDDSPPSPTFSEGQFRDARSMGTPDVVTAPEGEDIFRGFFMGVDDAIALHREASSKYRAELARCEVDLKKVTEERNALKLLCVRKEEEIMSIRAELTRAHQDQTELIEQVQQKAELVEQLHEEAKMKEAETLGWKQSMDHLGSEKDTVRAQLSSVERQLQSVKVENLERAQKVKELETRLVVELARATSEAEALVASYQTNVEAANTRTKGISDADEVRLSCVAEHARSQSRRETLEEVHARGFDLTADIENAMVLEDEVGALLFDDEDSTTRSESGIDEDDAPEDAAPEAD